MAKKKKQVSKRTPRKRAQRERPPQVGLTLEGADESTEAEGGLGAQTTGRSIVTFVDASPAAVKSALTSMKTRAGVSHVCRMADFAVAAFDVADTEDADAIVFDELGIAVVGGDVDRMTTMTAMAAAGEANVIVEPEYVNYAFSELALDEDVLEEDETGSGAGPSELSSISPDFLRGYQQAVNQLVESLTGGGAAFAGVARAEVLAAFNDTATATWGLHATRVLNSRFTGRGIRIAVLDTGMDLRHPDFAGRTIQTQSFISGQAVQDGHGHGTHCIGTSCGPRRPGAGPRYGVACDAEIFAGKVLSNAGSGSDGGILGGINWAVRNRCQVVSMSLGRLVQQGERPMQSYETAGRRALQAGTLIVAAAGNDSSRPHTVVPVSSPANAASIVAVAAVDANLRVARFSNGGINPGGGEINLAGPGVDVHSSWPMPQRLRSISGTSMATPHVAGIAALVAQEIPAARGVRLYHALRRRARRLSWPRSAVGNGLVEAV